jgi:hypothetical protein
MNSGAGITTPAPTQCSSCPPPNPFSRCSRRPRTPGSPRCEPREYGSWSKTRFPSACASGFQAGGRLIGSCGVLSGAHVLVLEARGASRGNGVRGHQRGFPQLALRASKQGTGPTWHKRCRISPTTKPPYIPSRAIASVTVFSPSGCLPAISPPEPPWGQSSGSA